MPRGAVGKKLASVLVWRRQPERLERGDGDLLSELLHEVSGIVYYQRTGDLLDRTLFKDVPDPRMRAQLVNLVIPYIEGFTVTGPLSGLDVEESVRFMMKIILSAAQ